MGKFCIHYFKNDTCSPSFIRHTHWGRTDYAYLIWNCIPKFSFSFCFLIPILPAPLPRQFLFNLATSYLECNATIISQIMGPKTPGHRLSDVIRLFGGGGSQSECLCLPSVLYTWNILYSTWQEKCFHMLSAAAFVIIICTI